MDLASLLAGEEKRKTFAQMLARQSAETTPTPSWGAGLARALQGGMAGLIERGEKNASGSEFDKLYGGGPAPAAPYSPQAMGAALQPQSPPQPSAPPAIPPQRLATALDPTASTAPRDAVMPSAKVWGDKEAEAAGLYEPTKAAFAAAPAPAAIPPPAAAQPAPQQTAQAQPTGQRTAPQIPPDIQARARDLWVGGEKAAAAAMLQPYTAPKDQVRPMNDQERAQWKVPEGVSAGINSADGKPVFSAPANSVNVNTVANPVMEGVGKQILDQRKAAQAATNTIPMMHEARKLLDEGINSGIAGNFQTSMQKVGALFGIPADQAANTEAFRATVGNQVLSHIKELGANPSNADRDYIEKVQGGQIHLEEKSLRRILDINEKYSRQAIQNFNRDADKLMSHDQKTYSSIAPLMKFEEPGQYVAPEKKQAAGGQVIDGYTIKRIK